MNQDTLLSKACMGNHSAIRFLEAIGGLTQIWDDLIDRDKPIGDDDINDAFKFCMVEIPRNAFYRDNFLDLQPVIEQSITQWIASAKIEKTVHHDLLPGSFITRGSFNDLITRCAFIIGGSDHAEEIAIDVMRWTLEAETYQQYYEEIMGGSHGLVKHAKA